MFDAEKVKNECVQWIRDWFAENGPDCNAIIGISGGKDSSVVAALCVEALGKDRVIGVLMPNTHQYELTHKIPSDGLCGKTDEDNFGFTYEVLNKYIRSGICEDENIKNKIDTLHTKNLFKLLPMPKFEYKNNY